MKKFFSMVLMTIFLFNTTFVFANTTSTTDEFDLSSLFSDLGVTSTGTGTTETSSTVEKTVRNANGIYSITASADPDNSRNIVVIGDLKSINSENIQRANIKLTYDNSKLDITTDKVKIGTAMALDTIVKDVSINNGEINFAVSSKTAFKDTSSKILFIAVFKTKDENTSLNSLQFKSTPTLLSSDGTVLNVGTVSSVVGDLASDYSYKTTKATVVSETNSSTITGNDSTWDNSSEGYTIDSSVSSGQTEQVSSKSSNGVTASQIKAGAFENIILMFSFLILGVYFLKRKRKA